MTIAVKAGTTNISVTIRIIDASDGTPELSVTSATSGLDLQYRREGAVSTALTESDLSALTDAHTDGGMLHIGNGYYRLDLPDAAVASGVTGCLVHGIATGMVVIGEYIQLVSYDPFDAVRLGLTALPNAAADAAGGLPVSDAGGLDLDTLNSNVSAVLVDTGTDGVIVATNNDKTGYSISGTKTTLDALNDITAAAAATSVLTTQMSESYAANGVSPTLAQATFAIHQMLMQFGIAGTALTVRRLNNSTTAFVVTLDDASAPTDAARV